MVFDSLILASVTDELERTIVGAKVERVVQPSPSELVLTLYHRGAKFFLLLSADPREARVHLTSERRDVPTHPPAFCMLLRKYLAGAWVESVQMPRGFADRVLHLGFHAHDGAHYTLIAETMGRHSNLVFVNAAGTILGCAKTITRAINRVRETRPGLPYVPPPRPRGKADPFGHFEPQAATPPVAGEETQWLMETFDGVSPLLAREAVLRAQPPLTPESLWYGLNTIVTRVRVSDYEPRLWDDGQGHVLGAYPIPLLSVPPRDQHPRDSISVALDQAAASEERRDAFAHARDALRTALHRTRRRQERERGELEKGLENAARADEYQQTGELLLAHPHLVPPGTELAVLPDYYAPPQADGHPALRAVPLDPAMDARENAERFFKRARKARDGREATERRLAAMEREVTLLEQAARDVEAAETSEQIASVRERVAAALDTPAPGRAAPGAREAPAFDGHKIKTYRSPDGWEILVGENATSNDYLTTKLAAPGDIWLHVRAATSAHGVIRTGNRPAAVSPAALRQAAELVAARSEVKHSSLIPVDYTLKKYVNKPRRSAPGSVIYRNEKTLHVTGI